MKYYIEIELCDQNGGSRDCDYVYEDFDILDDCIECESDKDAEKTACEIYNYLEDSGYPVIRVYRDGKIIAEVA